MTARLELEDNLYSDNAWYVDWIKIWTEGANFNCNVGASLQRGDGYNSTMTFTCNVSTDDEEIPVDCAPPDVCAKLYFYDKDGNIINAVRAVCRLVVKIQWCCDN